MPLEYDFEIEFPGNQPQNLWSDYFLLVCYAHTQITVPIHTWNSNEYWRKLLYFCEIELLSKSIIIIFFYQRLKRNAILKHWHNKLNILCVSFPYHMRRHRHTRTHIRSLIKCVYFVLSLQFEVQYYVSQNNYTCNWNGNRQQQKITQKTIALKLKMSYFAATEKRAAKKNR